MSRTNDLVKAMVDIRDKDRAECGRYLFEQLGYSDSAFITESQLDELLFMTVRKRLGTSIHADMLLMAFGLLPGYEYENLTIGKRREKFLRESNWLKINKRSKAEDYNSASEEELKSARDSLRNVERHWMEQIADELTTHVKLKDENGNEIKDALKEYIKLLKNNMEAVQDAYGKIIDYIPKVPLSFLPDNKDCVPNEVPTGSEEPNEQDALEEVSSSDEPNTTAFLEDDPVTTGGRQDNHSKAESQFDNSVPPSKPSKTRITRDINGSIVIQFNGVDTRLQWLILPVCVVLVLVVLLVIALLVHTCFSQSDNEPSIQNNVLVPGEIRQLVIVWPSDESIDGLLEYVSSDPSLIEVSNDGFILAHQGQPGETSRTADIVVQNGNEIIETRTFTVDFTQDTYEPPVEDIDDFIPEFIVEQKVRLVGTSDWEWGIEAEVGDTVEIQIQYKNLNDRTVSDVMVRDILPTNLVYIPGSAKLYNTNNPDGRDIEDTVATTTGINIKHYNEGANAYIRFTARVVDATLEIGSNTLVSWAQACVNGVTLQDYATVTLQKVE